MSQHPSEMGQGRGTLSTAAGMVADARSDLDRLSAQLDDRIAALGGGWTGAGGEAFRSLQQAWSDRQRVIVGALDQFAQSLTSTEKDNMHTDALQSDHYRRAVGRLGA